VEVVVELRPRARVEQRDGLDQARDVRVVDRVLAEPQPARDLRVRGGELGPHLAQERKLAVEVGQQVVGHRRHRRTAPRAGCRLVFT